jgi:hypothetical protein
MGLLVTAVGLLQGARLWMGMPLVSGVGINSVATMDSKVALSINIADDDTQVAELTTWLDDNNIPATLFVSSAWADSNPYGMDLVANNDNIEIGLIGDNSTNLLTTKTVERDIVSGIRTLADMSSREVKLYRTHQQKFGKSLLGIIKRLGLQAVGSDVNDAICVNSSMSMDAIGIVNASSSGSIVSIDANRGLSATILVVHGLLNKGLEIVQVGQLVLEDNYTLDSSGRQWAI